MPAAHGRAGCPCADAWTAGIGVVGPPALLVLILVPLGIWLNRAPQFAVFPSGIKVNVKRIPPGQSVWDPWSYGFYSWDEVGFCRWSPYEPGMLTVHLAAAEQDAAAGLLGIGPDHLTRVPAMICFQRVPSASGPRSRR